MGWACRLGEELRHRVGAHVGDAHSAGNRQDCRSSAGEKCPVCAGLQGGLDERIIREHVLAVRLVQPVFHGVAQRVEPEAERLGARRCDVFVCSAVVCTQGRTLAYCPVAKQLTSIAAREMLNTASLYVSASGRHARAAVVGISSSGMYSTHCMPLGRSTRWVIHWPPVLNAI